MHKQHLQKAMDARLSGLRAKQTMRNNVRRHMEGETVVKKKMTLGMAAALALIMITAGAAIATNLNLNKYIGTDPTMAYIAGSSDTFVPLAVPSATDVPLASPGPTPGDPFATPSPMPSYLPASPSPMPLHTLEQEGFQAQASPTPSPILDHAFMQDLPVTVEDAYFDGNRIIFAYRIKGGYSIVKEYTPTPDELDHMNTGKPNKGSQGVWMASLNTSPVRIREMNGELVSVTFGQANTGSSVRTLFTESEFRNADGTELTIDREQVLKQDEDILVCIYLEPPLHLDVNSDDPITLETDFSQQHILLWFDGHYVYSKVMTYHFYTMQIPIDMQPPIEPEFRTGQWRSNGNVIDFKAEVSRSAITLQYPSVDGQEFTVYDPLSGSEATLLGTEYLDDGTVLQTFEGLGRMPDRLYACLVTFEHSDPDHPDSVIRTLHTWQRALLAP